MKKICIFDCLIWTFNLPNFQGRYLKQGTSGTYGAESLPNITGNSNIAGLMAANVSGRGALSKSTRWSSNFSRTSGTESGVIKFDASDSSPTYQDGAKVNPDNAEILYCIKY